MVSSTHAIRHLTSTVIKLVSCSRKSRERDVMPFAHAEAVAVGSSRRYVRERAFKTDSLFDVVG